MIYNFKYARDIGKVESNIQRSFRNIDGRAKALY